MGTRPQVRLRVGIDTGGTFTDLVAVHTASAERRTVKVPSTPGDPARAVREALGRLGWGEIEFFVLGTTIATNCLLERRGARTIYVTTTGFEDVPFIQRINRQGLYDLQWVKPKPYVNRRDCLGVRERIAADGSVRVPLDDVEIKQLLERLEQLEGLRDGSTGIAVNLLFSFVNSEHESRLAAAIRTAFPNAPVSVSHEVAPVWREYERASTVIVDAYLRPLVTGFVGELERVLAERDVSSSSFLLKSNGGQVPVADAARQPSNLALSGLAGGMIAGGHLSDELGRRNVITLDMGGTSADVGIVAEGRIRSASACELEFGLPIAVPVVDLSTIGAGGSSIARFDQGGLLAVGPASAGAEPGPAAYGKGGTAATVTDANLVLGRLNAEYFLGGELRLDAERARTAIAVIARRLDATVEDAANAIVEIATTNMAGAIRLLCADRGLDYRAFDLMAFGGAGPLHGALLARRLGVRTVLIPPQPGLASALGALAADLRVDRRLTLSLRTDLAVDEDVRRPARELAARTLAELESEGGLVAPVLVLTASCRYAGQNFEQDVQFDAEAIGSLVILIQQAFHDVHEQAYGYRVDGGVVEIVHLNATAIDRREPIPRAAAFDTHVSATSATTRAVYLPSEGWTETSIYRRGSLGAGTHLDGPAIVEEADSTTLVLGGQSAEVHPSGTLILMDRQSVAHD